jgi:hypothetical protein
MGLIYFQPSRRESAPEILHYTPTSTATLALGEPVQRNSGDPELIEAHAGGATVTGILGTALGTVTSGTVPFGSKVQVAIARRDTLWLGQIYDVSASAVATAAVATHEGNRYGMVEPTAGQWFVDEEDTSDLVLRVVKVYPQINAVAFRWIGSAIEGA